MEDQQIEKKKVQILGFTENSRKSDLNKKIAKLEKEKWSLIEYIDDGLDDLTGQT